MKYPSFACMDYCQAQMPIPKGAKKIHKILTEAKKGTQVYVVGGAVRDYFYSQFHGDGQYSPKDVDLTTNLTEDEIIVTLNGKVRVHEKQSLNTFGVVFAHADGQDFEIAPFRKDVGGGDGRHPDKVEQGTILDDAARRDFTINSLYYDIESEMVIDFNGGVEDIRNRRIRTVGDPFCRFDEDKLRILRMIRFFTRYNPDSILEHIDVRMLGAVKKFANIRSYLGISSERIVTEFLAGLQQCLSPVKYLESYQVLGLMETVFPGMTVDISGINTRNPKVALAAMLLNEAKPSQILNELKYPGEISDNVQFLRNVCHLDPKDATSILRTRAFRFASQENTEDLREMAKVVKCPEQQLILNHLADNVPFWPPAEPLLAIGLVGPEIGKRQREQAQEWYTATLENYRIADGLP